MYRLTVFLVISLSICTRAQTTSQPLPTSDAQAVSLAQQAVQALTGGASIQDVTLNANVISILGSDNESGTGVFAAKGISESRIDLSLPNGTRSDTRTLTNGVPSGAWKRNSAAGAQYAEHNCWNDAAWFFPALSSLSQTANPNFVFKYVGQEQHSGVAVQHIVIFQVQAQDTVGAIQRLSATDFYLGTVNLLPVAMDFAAHPDNDMNTNLPTEILFANYRSVNGIQTPFHFQRIVNGGVLLDVTVTGAAFNTGLPNTSFSLQ